MERREGLCVSAPADGTERRRWNRRERRGRGEDAERTERGRREDGERNRAIKREFGIS
jgi:hypothetical protein